MASITDAGIQPDDLTTYTTELETLFRAVFGADLNLAAETPQGQFIGIAALFFAAQDEIAVHTANGLNLFTAAGLQLDDMGTLFSHPRIAGERSSVMATLTGTGGTIIAAGARARTTGGATFFLAERAVIGADGTIDGTFRSQALGPIVAGAGELTQIVDVVSGWTAITNAAAASLGRNAETDHQYQQRYRGEVAVHARDALEAIRARVLQVESVTGCRTVDNDTTVSVTTQGIAIAAGSLLVIVEGGTDADVGQAIAATKGIGTPTVGDESVDVTLASGQTVTIRFRRVTEIPITVTVNLTAGAAFPSDGLATMRSNLLQWFTGAWPTPGPGIFDQTGIGIGESIDLNRLVTPLNAVPGHTLGTVTVLRKEGMAALGTPNLDERYTLASGDISFMLT